MAFIDGAKRPLIAVAILACFAGCNASSRYATPGALYVVTDVPGAPPFAGRYETEVVREGRVVAHRPDGLEVARDRPDRWLVNSDALACSGREGAYRLSPDGLRVLCSQGDRIRVFDPAHPRSSRVIDLDGYTDNANDTSFGWLDNS